MDYGTLFFYGIVLNQPVAAVGLFGLVSVLSAGHMVSTLMLSMIAMLFTAASYGRMAGLFPSAGSAYTYVGRGLNPHLGFIAGWAMILCYMVIPIINTVFGVLTVQRLFPGLSFPAGGLNFRFNHYPFESVGCKVKHESQQNNALPYADNYFCLYLHGSQVYP